MTSIEWTDKTWNPTRGCSRVSPGCDNCYAMRQAHRFSGPGNPYEGLTKLKRPAVGDVLKEGRKPGRVDWTGKVVLVPRQLAVPLKRKKPTTWFVNSMSDLFHEALSNEDIAAVFGVMAACPQHRFQLLTKRPKRMLEWYEWVAQKDVRHRLARPLQALHAIDVACQLHASEHHPGLFGHGSIGGRGWPLPNVWLGVSVEDQPTADERIPLLLQVPAAIRFVSAEPLLGPVDLTRLNLDETCACGRPARFDAFATHCDCDHCMGVQEPVAWHSLDWVIVGGESGRGARPFDIAWARNIIAQCRGAAVPVFVKQLGALPYMREPGWEHGWAVEDDVRARWPTSGKKGGDISEWPEDLRVREMPVQGDV